MRLQGADRWKQEWIFKRRTSCWRPQKVGDTEAKARGSENKEPPWIDTFSESLAGSYGLH